MPEYPPSMLAAGKGGVVESFVLVDINGIVEAATPTEMPDDAFSAPTAAALRKWKFTPTLVDGKPTSYWFVVPLEFSVGGVHLGAIRDEDEPDVMPKLVKSVQPIYPQELVKSGNHGRVMLLIIIDKQGNVMDPRVTEATHPAFVRPAIDAILKWKFSPATKDGQPIFMWVEQPIEFRLNQTSGVDAFSVSKGSKKNIPDKLRVDTQPKPKTTVFAVYPYGQAIAGTRGSARVKFVVGADGTVVVTSIVEASEPEFGLALAAAMEAWAFEPAMKDKKPSPAILNRKYEFKFGDRDSAIDSATEALARRIRNGKFEPAKAGKLDAPLKPKFVTPPVYPTALLLKALDGTAKIEVIVDKKGRAVLPRIVEASAPEFGWAAATAAQRWLFEPPTVGGKPVEVQVMIPFKFTVPQPVSDTDSN